MTRLEGVLAPVVTPFRDDGSPDAERFVAHCRWLLDSGCRGLAVFGTNSEANSLSVDERLALLDAVVEAGIPAEALMPGTGCCALTDTVRLTARAVELGCSGVLVLPPFFYKDVTVDGLHRSFATVIDAVGDDRLRVYLYHIPQVAGVPISLPLVDRLRADFPDVVVGMKDSSGDWANTEAVLDAHASSGFDVFVGSEVFLLDNLRRGGRGCITATGNVNPAAINGVFEAWQAGDADAGDLQARITAARRIVQRYPMIAALKAIVARWSRDPAWTAVRPPLVELDPEQEKALVAALEADGFSMPGLAAD